MSHSFEQEPFGSEPEVVPPFTAHPLEITDQSLERIDWISSNQPDQRYIAVTFGRYEFEGKGVMIDLPDDRSVCLMRVRQASDFAERNDIIVADSSRMVGGSSTCWIVKWTGLQALSTRPHDCRNDAILEYGLRDAVDRVWEYEPQSGKPGFSRRLAQRLFKS